MIKCLLTQIDRARRENIWLSVMTHGFRSVGYDLEPHIFPSDPLGQLVLVLFEHVGECWSTLCRVTNLRTKL